MPEIDVNAIVAQARAAFRAELDANQDKVKLLDRFTELATAAEQAKAEAASLRSKHGEAAKLLEVATATAAEVAKQHAVAIATKDEAVKQATAALATSTAKVDAIQRELDAAKAVANASKVEHTIATRQSTLAAAGLSMKTIVDRAIARDKSGELTMSDAVFGEWMADMTAIASAAKAASPQPPATPSAPAVKADEVRAAAAAVAPIAGNPGGQVGNMVAKFAAAFGAA